MNLDTKIRLWVRDLFHVKRSERELDAELRFDLAQRIEANVRAGMVPEDARGAALREFGGFELTKEECRDERGTRWLEDVWQDVRFGLRMLRKSPGFTAVAILTLALGIGANTAIFSVVEGVVLAPLPYSQPDRLVMVWESNPRFPRVFISYPNFRDWQLSSRSFQQMAAFRQQGYDLTNRGAPEHLDGKAISAGFFTILGANMSLGRDFTLQEDVQGGASAVIISNRLWKNRFDGSSSALGKSLTLSGVDYAIIGIAPVGFRLLGDADVFTPLAQDDPTILSVRSAHDGIRSIARLNPGVSLPQAQAEMSAIQKNLDQLYPDDDRDLGTDVGPLKEQIVGNTGGSLLLLLGAVGLVLLIACANVANLLLARSAARSREFAIRAALGASRPRVVRQLLTESVLLSLAGGGLGLAFAMWGVKLILATMPGTLARSQEIGLNLPVLLFAFGIAVTVGLLFGLVPALKVSKSDLQDALKKGGRTSSGGQHRVQSFLVIVQMALTLVLLVGSGLLLRTIRNLWDVNAGFDAQHVVTFKVGVSHSLTKTPASTRAAYQQLIERIRSVPGVQAADFTDVVPLNGDSSTMPFWTGSQRPASLQAAPRLLNYVTGPDYLQAMGIPLLRGRFFTQEDTTKTPCVIVIDSAFVRMYFPDTDPIGQSISAGFVSMGPCRIVGVVGHVRQWGLDDSARYIQNEAYFPLYQDPDQWVAAEFPGTTVMVRTPLDAAAVMPSIKAAVLGAGGDQPIFNVQTMQEIVSRSMDSQRFPMILLGVFAALALLLASVGIYGVISYSVAQRVPEIGIRMALGAEKPRIFRMIIGQGLRLALAGLVIGAVAALILTRLLSSFSHLLYGVRTSDPVTFIAVSAVLTGVAILACYIPARRATRVDPMTALHHE